MSSERHTDNGENRPTPQRSESSDARASFAVEEVFEKAISQYTNILFRGQNNATTINNLENIIESSLVRADELKALLNNVKNDSQTATDILLPQLAEHCKQLLRVFQVIDSLSEVVLMLKSSATELNEKLQKVQQVYDLRHPSSFGRFIGKLSRSSSMDKSLDDALPPMPKWEGSEFLQDTTPILKEARLKWLDSAPQQSGEKPTKASPNVRGERQDSIDV